MDFVAGIDGGGTKTTVLCHYIEDGHYEEKRFGAFNINSIGEPAFIELLDEIIAYLKSLGTCRALVIGAAGISNKRMGEIVSEKLKEAGIALWDLVGDSAIALEGALDGGPGISLIAGTGSICFGKGPDGTLQRAGGWGHLIGDEGCGYGLGRDAFFALTKDRDGYGKKTMITQLVADKLGLDHESKIISYVYRNDKSAVAALSPIVEEAYDAGDEVAVEIVKSNALALARIVKCVSDKLALDKPAVATLGGLIAKDTCMRKELKAALDSIAPETECIYPIKDAAQGAIMLAHKLLGA